MRLNVLSFLLVLSFCYSAYAQNDPGQIDVRPFAPIEGGAVDSVSDLNGSLMIHIPLLSYPQRGTLKLDFSLKYDSPTYNQNYTCSGTVEPGVTSAQTSGIGGAQPTAQPTQGVCNGTFPLCPTGNLLGRVHTSEVLR
jgi:hypothetical protein